MTTLTKLNSIPVYDISVMAIWADSHYTLILDNYCLYLNAHMSPDVLDVVVFIIPSHTICIDG